LCKINADNLKNFLEIFAEKGEVFFYTNLCPFTGWPDAMSEDHTLRSEEEIRKYLKEDAARRFEEYMRNRNIDYTDYLVATVLEFCKANSRYPRRDEMRQLEQTAEATRVAELPADTATAEISQTVEEAMREIMELAEEIFESRRMTRPEDIFCPVEPYYDRLDVESGEFRGSIEWDSYYGRGDCRDYHLRGQLGIDRVSFRRHYDGTASGFAKNWRGERTDLELKHIIAVHKSIVDLAKREGIEFISEIDYENLGA